MVRFGARCTLATVALAMLSGGTASAQVFGTFSWQMQNYCNVVTLTITQIPAGYTINGFDDQCGGPKRASVAGMALINPDGTVGLDFTVVAAPDGTGSHVSASVSPGTGSGTWADSGGNTGTFVLAGAAAGLSPRPTATSTNWSRALPVAERFVLVLGGQAVLDNETGLTWERTPATATFNWYDTSYQCALKNLGNRQGWRPPSVYELLALAQKTGTPALPAGHPFTIGAAPLLFWTGTDYGSAGNRFLVDLGNGTFILQAAPSQSYRVWCVRAPGNGR